MQRKEEGWVRRPIDGAAAEALQPQSSLPPAAKSTATFLGAGAEFEGTLRLRESFRIDAEFRGAIESEGTIVVGESAGVEAHIRAREVEIRGAVVGDVTASRMLVIRAGGRLHGDVSTPCFELERGAFFNGTTRMERPESALRSAAARSAAEPPAAAAAAPVEPAAPAASS